MHKLRKYKIKKRFVNLILLIMLVLILSTCEKEYIQPIDIFETETLTDTFNLDIGNRGGTDTLYVNADRIVETDFGYHIKGTIFSQSILGVIPVTSGDFYITSNEISKSIKNGSHLDLTSFDFSGYGTADFPNVGILTDAEIDDVPGSYTYYNTGKVFKEESKISLLPLKDERYYFRYKIDNPKKGKEYKIKKASFKLREFYLDAHDPATLFIGDLYSKNSKGVKRLVAEQVGVGLSANELWEFTPYEYSDRLEEAVEGTGFKKINGGIYISGIVPIKKYPVKISGQAVINTSYSSSGKFDFFERGFDDASFQMGANGKLLFDNQFVKFIPGLDTIELGHGTLMAELGDDGNAIRVAGEYSNDYLKDFIESKRLTYISYNEKHGFMYLRCTEDLEDMIVYLEESIHFSVPGLGDKELAKSVFKVTKDKVEVSGIMELPYDIGDVKLLGTIYADGSFLLEGTTNCSVNFGDGLSYEAELTAEVSNEGVILYGEIILPYNIGAVEVEGAITTEEVKLSGIIDASLGFPTDVYLHGDLLLKMSSKTGIYLEGGMVLPAGIGNVSVYGYITSKGLDLSGEISEGVDIDLYDLSVTCSTEMILTLSSVSGVTFTGKVKLPCGLGKAKVTGHFEPDNELTLYGDLNSNVKIGGYGYNIEMEVCATTIHAGCQDYLGFSFDYIDPGLYLEGKMKFPGEFGWVELQGSVNSYSFSLHGSLDGLGVDFYFGSVTAYFDFDVTNYRIDVSGESEFCLIDICKEFGIEVNDINTSSPQLCVNFDIGFDNFDQCLSF